MLAAGVAAPQFELRDTEGNPHSLKSLTQDGPVLLALFKISCPVCQLTLPYLERIAKGRLRVIAISQDDARATAKFREKFGITLPTLLDSEETGYPVSNAFKITHVPSLFLVEAGGVIERAGTGFRKSELEEFAQRSGVRAFNENENVPAWKAG
jgi:peroxiredoxin